MSAFATDAKGDHTVTARMMYQLLSKTDAKRQVCRSRHYVSGLSTNDKVDERDELNKSSTPKQIFEVGAGIMITKCN